MPPGEDEQALRARLAAVYRDLATALKQQDWQAMGQADLEVRECLQVLKGLQQRSDALVQIRKQLQQLHGLATDACRQECEKLRQILQAHLTYSEGRSAYSQVSLFQDE